VTKNIIAIGFLMLFVCAIASAQDSVQTTSLPGASAKLFAISPDTGEVLFGSSSKPIVTMCPRLASEGVIDQSVSKKLDENPTQIIFKRLGQAGFFFVLCQGNNTVYQLDPSTLKVVNKITLKEQGCSIAATFDPKNDFIYYGASTGIGRVDWNKLADSGLLPSDYPRQQGSCQDIAITCDGSMIYAKPGERRGGVVFFQVNDLPDGGAFLQSMDQSNQVIDSFVSDPIGPGIAYNRTFLGRMNEPGESYDRLSHTSIGFMAGRPLIFVISNGDFIVYSHNSNQELARVTVGQRQQNYNNEASVPIILADEKHQTVLICGDGQVQTIALSIMNLPVEPILNISLLAPTAPPTPAKEMRIPFVRTNPAETVEIALGPTGMTVEGDELVWKSDDPGVGTHPIRVRISAGGVSRVQEFSVVVSLPHIDLPFDPTDVAISDDGRLAVVYQRQFQQMYGGQGTGDNNSTMAIVDLEKQTVIASRVLQRPMQGVAVDATHVYAAVSGANVVYIYSTKDLSEQRRVFAAAPVQSVRSVAGRVFISSGMEIAVYNAGDLSAAGGVFHFPTMRELANDPFAIINQIRAPEPVGDEWYFAGMFYNADMSRVLAVQQPLGFWEFPSGAENGGRGNMYDYLTPGEWGIHLEGNQLTRAPNQVIGQLSAVMNAVAVLNGFPAAATMNTIRNNTPTGTGVEKTVVDFFELGSLTKQTERVLDESNSRREFFAGNNALLRSAPGKLIAVNGSKLYVLKNSTLNAAKFPIPPYVVSDQRLPVIDPAKPTQITFSAQSMKGAVEYSLETQVPNVTIDGKTGVVTIDGKSMVDAAAKSLATELYREAAFGTRRIRNPAGTPPSADALVAAYVRRLTPSYVRIFGHEPKDAVPVAVRLVVAARDSEQQEVQMTCVAFLQVPIQTVAARMSESQDQNLLQPQNNPNSDLRVINLEQELRELHRHNDELEAQNRLLKEMVLEKQQNGDTTRASH
jgi:hypothetical protein